MLFRSLEEPAEARLMALFYRPITIATALARRRLFGGDGCRTAGAAQLPEQFDELVQHARGRAPDAVAVVREGRHKHLASLVITHFELHVALIH